MQDFRKIHEVKYITAASQSPYSPFKDVETIKIEIRTSKRAGRDVFDPYLLSGMGRKKSLLLKFFSDHIQEVARFAVLTRRDLKKIA